MEMDGIRRAAYWITFFVFMLILALFMSAERLTLIFKLILLLLFAILSSMFRLKYRYSFISIALVIIAAFFLGAVIATGAIQFWIFAILFVVIFFLSCEVFERNMLGV